MKFKTEEPYNPPASPVQVRRTDGTVRDLTDQRIQEHGERMAAFPKPLQPNAGRRPVPVPERREPLVRVGEAEARLRREAERRDLAKRLEAARLRFLALSPLQLSGFIGHYTEGMGLVQPAAQVIELEASLSYAEGIPPEGSP